MLLTLRDQMDTMASLISRWSYVTLDQALNSYIGFYRKIEPYAPPFLLSRFHQNTNNLDIVFQAVNERFSTDFSPFKHCGTRACCSRSCFPEK